MSIISEDRLEELSRHDKERYSRHLLLPEVGLGGQRRLKAARVLVAGTGGLGSPLALYLAAAGIGTLGLLDFDLVEESNLQRQILHSVKDMDRPKTASSRDRVRDINPALKVIVHNTRLTSKNALSILKDYDVVADGTDNFPTRYLINDACVLLGIPLVYGSILQFEGQATVFDARRGPCYRCLHPAPPPPGLVPSCGEGGVMGALPGIIGTIQACEVIKLILGGGDGLTGRLLLLDAWEMRAREFRLDKDPNCPVCGEHPSLTELIDYEEFCGLNRKDEAPVQSLTAGELRERLERREPLQIIDIREPHEQTLIRFENARVVPFGQLVRRMDEFDPSVDAVFICKIGQRSLYAIRELRRAGYRGRMFNLAEGLNAWARETGAGLTQY
ncbi:MAG: molybdopterin-synthase adenylyltransferase MoeB [Desulfovibrio sp.]|nr:molybdopterin-synthase adenylyltransferase MoeB [Desulfovibrio sp.]